MFHNTSLASNAIWYGTNLTTANKSDVDVLTKAEIAAMRLCHSFLGSVGVLENLGVIFVILLNRILLDFPANWFVLSLAIADAITCVVMNVFENMYAIAGLKYLEVPVIAIRFVALASVGNLFLLTFNRFLSIHNSLKYHKIMTTSRAKCLVICPWIIAFILSPIYELLSLAELSQISYIVGIYYGALIISIILLNTYILKIARDKSKKIKRLEMQIMGRKTRYSTMEYLLSVKLLIVFVTFLASTVPLMAFSEAYKDEKSRRSVSFHRIFVWCVLAMELNAVVDPFVYSIDHPIFKRYLDKVLNLISPRNRIIPKETANQGSR